VIKQKREWRIMATENNSFVQPAIPRFDVLTATTHLCSSSRRQQQQHHRILTLVSNHSELTPPTATIQNGN
jgi:hypothetical protein